VSNRHDDPGTRREIRFRRWMSVGLRTLHLVSVIALGALVLGAAPLAGWPPGRVAGAVVISGLAMLALDVHASRLHLRTVAGLTGLGKLALVVALAYAPAPPLYWTIVVLSAVVSHAPATFRHRLVLVPRGRPPSS
jgi:hypothetical protein